MQIYHLLVKYHQVLPYMYLFISPPLFVMKITKNYFKEITNS